MGLLRKTTTRADLIRKQSGYIVSPDTTTFRMASAWIFVSGGRIVYWRKKKGAESVSLAGAHVDVNATGQLSRGFSGAGMLAFGVLGASKKQDSRRLFIVVQGTDGGLVVPVSPESHQAALSFAVKINVLAGSVGS